mmetsp:Transcript_74696/g.194243  ORF Transcript_74696/g.194243 Transcript_74696/m.194243 type:complete len:153 (+) Transcript_74696:1008-1466(+)
MPGTQKLFVYASSAASAGRPTPPTEERMSLPKPSRSTEGIVARRRVESCSVVDVLGVGTPPVDDDVDDIRGFTGKASLALSLALQVMFRDREPSTPKLRLLPTPPEDEAPAPADAAPVEVSSGPIVDRASTKHELVVDVLATEMLMQWPVWT